MKKHLFSTIALSIVMVFTSLMSYSQVFITELADPNNNAGVRYIELYNAGPSAVDFTEGTGWRIDKYTNASATVSQTLNLSGTIPSEGFYIIATGTDDGDFFTVYGVNADQFDGGDNNVAGSNGDDNLELYDGTNTLVDQFGVPGEDGTGTSHEFEDGRAERVASVTTGQPVYADANWNTWSDGPGGDAVQTKNAPDDFDPGAWIGPSAGTSPVITNISTDPASGFTSFDVVAVSADITDDGTISSAYLQWGIATGVLTNTITMELDEATTYVTETDIPAQAVGTTVYYKIYAEDNDMEVSESAELDYSVLYPATTALPYNQPYDVDLGSCYVYSVLGATKTWEHASYGGNGYANANGFNSGEIEEDWLITPAIDFDSYSNERMTFDTWFNYGSGDDVDNYLKLFYSPDYIGYGDPSGSTWTEIVFDTAATNNTWASSGTLDLSGVTGSNVHLAFKYNYNPGNYKWWQVDNIAIYEATPVDVTFQVNMEEQTVSPNGVHIAGSFQGWDPAATEMLDPELDGTYEVTVSLISGLTYEFKYINGNAWGTNGVEQEIVPVECELPGTGNRYEIVGETSYTIPAVCYGSCNDCGTPQFDITFFVDMQNEVVSGDGVYLAGSLTNWGDDAVAMTATGTIWSVTVPADELSNHQYKFVNGIPNSGGSWENFDGPCLPVPWGNRELYLGQENIVLDVVCFNSCDACPIADFVMINEVDADQASTDSDEFIELYDGGAGNTSLNGLVVVLFNGSDDQSYNDPIDLDGQSTDENGYFVIGSATVPNVDLVAFTTNGIQNGADAVALFVGNGADFPNDTPIPGDLSNLLDALVYDTGDGDDAALLVLLNTGQPQINEQGRGDGEVHSNQRIPNGSGGLRMTFTYDQSLPTPGAENIGIFTDWTGDDGSSVWNEELNWTNGVPTDMLNAEIPDVSGIDAPFPIISASAACMNLYMAGGSSLEIAPSGSLTVYGTFTNNGSLTIKSDASGTGSLIESNGVYANVENFLSQEVWHYVATPIDDANTSVFTGLYMTWWDEAAEDWGWVLSADSTLATDMQGYSVWADDDATLAYTGGLNTGAKSIAVTNTATTPVPDPDPTNDPSGFNFVGNPYSSALDWNVADGSGWTRTSENIGASLYIWNQAYGNYGVYVKDDPSGTNDVTNVIPSQQGFFVFCDANGTLGVDNGARMHSNSNVYKGGKDASPYVKLHVKGNGLQDEFMVNVNSLSTSGYDNMFDGLKMKGSSEAPQAYSLTIDGDELSVNSIPTIIGNEIIPVGIEVGEAGFYEFMLTEMAEFDGYPVLLQDLQENKIIDLKTSAYKFYSTPEDDANRFQLRFTWSDVFVSGLDNALDGIAVFTKDQKVVINSIEEISGNVMIFDIMGREIAVDKLESDIEKVIDMNVEKGTYIINIVTEQGVVNKKVFLK